MKNTKKLSLVLAAIVALNGGACALATAEEIAESAPAVVAAVETQAPVEAKTEASEEKAVTEETVTETPVEEETAEEVTEEISEEVAEEAAEETTEETTEEVTEEVTEEAVAEVSEVEDSEVGAAKAAVKAAGSYTLKATVSAVEDALESFKAAVLNGLKANKETADTLVTFTQEGDTVKAEFTSFMGLVMGTYGADNTWSVNNADDNGEYVRLEATTSNADVSLSDTIGVGDPFGYKLHNVDYIFSNSAIVRNDDTNDSFHWPVNNNDDGYFAFASMGHVSMTFDGCDLKQNVQSGTTGTMSDRNIDLIFRNCDFNGNSVLTMDEQVAQRNGNKDPMTLDTVAEDPIWKSYQGDNIGSLIIENCVNLRSINASGASWMGGIGLDADHNASKLSITNSTFIDSRNNLPEGKEIGDMLVFGQHFAAYEFAGNTWADGSAIFAMGFHSDGFIGAMQGDSFYQQNEAVNAKWASDNDAKLNNAEHWLNEVDGANAIVNTVKDALTYAATAAHGAFYVYGSIGVEEEEEEELPVTTPDEDPTETPEETARISTRTVSVSAGEVITYSLDDYETPLAGSSGCSEGDCFN